jgi:hypothetical protein
MVSRSTLWYVIPAVEREIEDGWNLEEVARLVSVLAGVIIPFMV